MLKACFCLIYREQSCLRLLILGILLLLCLILAYGYAYKEGKYGKIQRTGKLAFIRLPTGIVRRKREECRMDKKDREISVPLLAFTYFFSTSIYILLLGFYFWDWHKEDGK